MEPSDKDLKTKTGVVHRLSKELVSYIEELEDNQRRTAEVRASADHSKLKQWENVCAETQGMIPDTRDRLETALGELKALLNAPELAESSERTGALGAVENADKLLTSGTGAIANGH